MHCSPPPTVNWIFCSFFHSDLVLCSGKFCISVEINALLSKGLQMGNGLGFLQAPFPGADLWPGQGGPTGSKAATSCTGCSHSAWRNVTLGDTPAPCWAPAGTSGHSELWGQNLPPLRAHRHFCPCRPRGKQPCTGASWVCSPAALTLSGNGFLCTGLPGTLSLLLCVVFLVNQDFCPRKHYTNVTSPRYPTIKPLQSPTQTFSSSLRAAE